MGSYLPRKHEELFAFRTRRLYWYSPPWDGVYVGYYQAVSSESSGDTLKVIRDTGGGDWKPTLPAP